MGLVAPLPTIGGIPEEPKGNDTLITTKDIATSVKDTFINRTAIAPETYPSIFGTLLQYTKGVPIIVEYFKKRAPYINNQTIDTSFSLERAGVQYSFDLIHNLEIRIDEQLDIKIDQDTTETVVNGVGILYPGLNPNPGDVFLLKLPDNNIGVFLVNLTEPLSIYRGTHYQINFHLLGNLTTEMDTKLRSAVSDEMWFDKQSFFNDEVTLLKDTSYNQLNALLKYRKSIISRISNQFYNLTEKTIVRPDKVFDMHLVEYLRNKISVNDTRRDICQIPSPYLDMFDNCIWKTFLTQDVSILSLTGYCLVHYQQFLFDTNMSNIDHFKLTMLTGPKASLGSDQGTFADGNLLDVYEIDQYEDSSNLITIDENAIARVLNEDGFDSTKSSSRLTQVMFPSDTTLRTVNYYFSDRFYYALLHSFETGSVITDMTPLISDIINDKRIYSNLFQKFYSVSDNAYHDMTFFDTLSKVTGSNNDMHIPEIEYMVFDFILNNNIDLVYLVDKVLVKFPFSGMTSLDQLYTTSLLLHLIDVGIKRIR